MGNIERIVELTQKGLRSVRIGLWMSQYTTAINV